MQKAFWRLQSLDDTNYLAQLLVTALPETAVVALVGDLGAGKTTFSQQVAHILGVKESLPSPTFTLMNEYQLENRIIVHADLYRLHSLHDVQELGIIDYFTQSKTVTLVEWADRARKIFPVSTIWLDFSLLDNFRIVNISGENPYFWQRFQPGGKV